jgi:hypothetical protein
MYTVEELIDRLNDMTLRYHNGPSFKRDTRLIKGKEYECKEAFEVRKESWRRCLISLIGALESEIAFRSKSSVDYYQEAV